MKIQPLSIPEVLLIKPDIYSDDRGFFVETWQRDRYQAIGLPSFVQDNQSFSHKDVIRGLHAQHKKPQGKLVRAVTGKIWDVAVDIRPGSFTFGQHCAVELTGENNHQLWVPPGFLHGFCVLSDSATVSYKVSGEYDPKDEIGVFWNDPTLWLPWPIMTPIVSAKDNALPMLSELQDRLGF
jgi:dTDP-4-dehydrorhamnose 3,5-epimerase